MKNNIQKLIEQKERLQKALTLEGLTVHERESYTQQLQQLEKDLKNYNI